MFVTATPWAWHQALSTQSVPVAATAITLRSGSFASASPGSCTLLTMAIVAPAIFTEFRELQIGWWLLWVTIAMISIRQQSWILVQGAGAGALAISLLVPWLRSRLSGGATFGSEVLAFYRDHLGFNVTFQGPEPDDIFFGIVQRDAAMIMFKEVGVEPVPNYTRDVKKGIARWDAYLYVREQEALAAEFSSRNTEFSEPVSDTHDGLRGFELKDSDGYVLFFGRPLL